MRQTLSGFTASPRPCTCTLTPSRYTCHTPPQSRSRPRRSGTTSSAAVDGARRARYPAPQQSGLRLDPPRHAFIWLALTLPRRKKVVTSPPAGCVRRRAACGAVRVGRVRKATRARRPSRAALSCVAGSRTAVPRLPDECIVTSAPRQGPLLEVPGLPVDSTSVARACTRAVHPRARPPSPVSLAPPGDPRSRRRTALREDAPRFSRAPGRKPRWSKTHATGESVDMAGPSVATVVHERRASRLSTWPDISIHVAGISCVMTDVLG